LIVVEADAETGGNIRVAAAETLEKPEPLRPYGV